jgi:hypothetical protein
VRALALCHNANPIIDSPASTDADATADENNDDDARPVGTFKTSSSTLPHARRAHTHADAAVNGHVPKYECSSPDELALVEVRLCLCSCVAYVGDRINRLRRRQHSWVLCFRRARAMPSRFACQPAPVKARCVCTVFRCCM